jgi:hypothetical protein
MTRRRKTAAAAPASPAEDDTGESIRAAAAQYTVEALTELARIMREGKSEPARIAAAKELLDRAQSRRSGAGAGNDGKLSFVELVEQAAKEREKEEALARELAAQEQRP